MSNAKGATHAYPRFQNVGLFWSHWPRLRLRRFCQSGTVAELLARLEADETLIVPLAFPRSLQPLHSAHG